MWEFVVMEAPIACSPQLRSLAPHSISQATDEILVVLFGDCLTLCCALVVYNESPTRALNTSLKCCCPQLTLLTGGKNSRMYMNVQGRLMQARFIQIHQVFAKKRSDTFLTDLIYCFVSTFIIEGEWTSVRCSGRI